MPRDVMSGVPLANGMLGALVWGDEAGLIVSLDRADLWDLRPIPEYRAADYTNDTLAKLVEAKDTATIQKTFEAPYYRPAPTKLPAGRIRIKCTSDGPIVLYPSCGIAKAGAISLIVHADEQIGCLWGAGDCPHLTLEAPAFGQPPPQNRPPNPISPCGPEDLDYPLPDPIREASLSGYCQALPDGRAVCALAQAHSADGHWTIAWTIQIGASGEHAVACARAILSDWFESNFAVQLSGHTTWWENYWRKAWLAIPDETLERQWVLDAYKLGAAARTDCPAVSLQGQWTTDNGRLPPWKGDYHHDLNTQMTYWPCLTGNRLDAHKGFLDWLWETKPACERWTKSFFEVDGLAVPMTADLENNQLGGWAPYTHSPTSGAWLAHHFVLHWRYSGDRDFLAQRAWPYVRACAVFIDQLTRKDAKEGVRALRLSSSPEINNNGLDAWFPSWTNYDLALCRNLMEVAGELAGALGLDDEAAHWSCVLSELPALAYDDDGGFSVTKNVALATSHRHMSHMMEAHPLVKLAWNDPVLAATIARLEALGTSQWMGYSFAWMAGIYALAGRGDDSARVLSLFTRGFCAPNSFHTNGDISGEGYTQFPFNAFTLEGNCAAMASTQDMMLQSKSQAITLFPALPSHWTTARFDGLLAQGGIVVSAALADGEVQIVLLAQTACIVRLQITFNGPWHDVVLKPNLPANLTLAWAI